MFLISTPQRCGSTWLTQMLCGMAKSRSVYINGLAMGFRLAAPSQPKAVEKLARFMERRPNVAVFKTHDVAPREFDLLCETIPRLHILTLSRDFRDVVVSRYFYLRYYWPRVSSSGGVPRHFSEFLSALQTGTDQEALLALLNVRFLKTWAREWAAFEGAFKTCRALRLTYTGMLDQSDFPRLAEFTGLPLRKRRPFAIEQREEAQNSGRTGPELFHRKGRAGQWREWWTEEQGARLLSLADEALQNAATNVQSSGKFPICIG